jgi:hypothetical protein
MSYADLSGRSDHLSPEKEVKVPATWAHRAG